MPDQVKDVERLFQCAGLQHAKLFHNVWLREKRRKAKKQNKRDEKLVV